MTSPVLDIMARQGAMLAMLLGAGCAADETQQSPLPGEDPPPELVPEIVSSITDLPVDLAVDEGYVYWINATLIPDPYGPPLRRGSVMRWDKSTGERVELATIEDYVPVEIDVSSTYVYWLELGGYLSNGYRELGHDRLLRIPRTGGPSEVVASDQWFDAGPGEQVAVANGYVYWLSAGTSLEPTGVLRRTTEDGALTVVETVASDLDRPTMLAASSARVCFRTGDPHRNASPIWCMPAGGGAIDLIADVRSPRDMLFFDDRLYWTDAGSGRIERAIPDPGTTIETVWPSSQPPPSPQYIWPDALTSDATALLWTVSSLYVGGRVHALLGDSDTRIWTSETTYPHALASDGVHVYFVDSERVLRVPARP